MANDVVFIGWNRPVPGREQEATELFGESVAFYEDQKKSGNIDSYEPFLLDPHGGTINGFVLLRGNRQKLDAVLASNEWIALATKGIVYLSELRVLHGVTAEAVAERVGQYMAALPSK
jgi:hypothetical protein